MNIDPSRQEKVKGLNQLIFQKEDEAESARRVKQRQISQYFPEDVASAPKSNSEKETRTIITGYVQPKEKSVSNDDFDWDIQQKKRTNHNRNMSQAQRTPKVEPKIPRKDSFDEDFGKGGKTTSNTTSKVVEKKSNDDFNF